MTSTFDCGDLVDSQEWVKWDANSSVNECPNHHKKNCTNVLFTVNTTSYIHSYSISRDIETLLHSLMIHIVLQEHWQGMPGDKQFRAGEEE